MEMLFEAVLTVHYHKSLGSVQTAWVIIDQSSLKFPIHSLSSLPLPVKLHTDLENISIDLMMIIIIDLLAVNGNPFLEITPLGCYDDDVPLILYICTCASLLQLGPTFSTET